MKTKIVKIEKLFFNERIYPRNQVDWITVQKYKDAMNTGTTFPPVLVIPVHRKYVVIDGRHTYEALKKNKEEYITIEIIQKDFNEKDAYIEAIKRNITHGRAFSFQERLTIVGRLERFKVSQNDIISLVCLTQDTITKFKAKRMVRASTGKDVVLKSSIEHLKEVLEEIPDDINDDIPPLRTQIEILKTVINMFQKRLFNESNDKVMLKIGELFNLLKELYSENDALKLEEKINATSS